MLYIPVLVVIQVEYKLPNMERLALRKKLDFLLPRLKIVELATDASMSIIAMIGELHMNFCLFVGKKEVEFFLYAHTARDYPMILHSLDVWHKAKKLKKALEEVNYLLTFASTCVQELIDFTISLLGRKRKRHSEADSVE